MCTHGQIRSKKKGRQVAAKKGIPTINDHDVDVSFGKTFIYSFFYVLLCSNYVVIIVIPVYG